ncbi:MAG: hypothetical protein PVF93_01720 [Chromatiaceae bacterium]
MTGQVIKEDVAKAIDQKTAAALDSAKAWSGYGAFVGMDVHKETIAVAVALPGREEPEYLREIAYEAKAVRKRRKQLRGCRTRVGRVLGLGHRAPRDGTPDGASRHHARVRALKKAFR